MFDRTSASLGGMCRAAIVILASCALSTPAWPQTPPAPQPAPPQAEPAPTPSPPPRPENPGLLNEMGKLLDKFPSLPTLKSPTETIEDLNTRGRDAADSLSKLARPGSMVSGRAVCPVSANGAPDCKAGADKLCQLKGFREGKSLTVDTAETCSPKVFIPGRQRKPDDCRTDNFVTRALCQ